MKGVLRGLIGSKNEAGAEAHARDFRAHFGIRERHAGAFR